MFEKLGLRHFIRNRIASVSFDAVKDHLRTHLASALSRLKEKSDLSLGFIQKLALVREIGDKEPGEDTKNDCNNSFYDKNPLPSIEATKTLHKREDIGYASFFC